MASDEVLQKITTHTYGTWRAQKGWKKPVYIKDAEGVYLFDDTGKKYLDFSSQLMCSNIGHKNKVIIDAIVKQAQIMPYIGPVFAQGPMESAVDALHSYADRHRQIFLLHFRRRSQRGRSHYRQGT